MVTDDRPNGEISGKIPNVKKDAALRMSNQTSALSKGNKTAGKFNSYLNIYSILY